MRFFSSLLFATVGFAGLISFAESATAQSTSKPSPFQDVKTLTGTAAHEMVDACIAFAKKNNMEVTIVVVDPHADIIELHKMDGAHMQAYRTAQLKARTALFNRRTTREVADRVAQGNNSAIWLGDLPQPGGIPIMVDGKAAGAIGVGGGSENQDSDCAQVAIDTVIGKTSGK